MPDNLPFSVPGSAEMPAGDFERVDALRIPPDPDRSRRGRPRTIPRTGAPPIPVDAEGKMLPPTDPPVNV